MNLTGKNGKRYTLGEVIAGGGEGTVHALRGEPYLVAKLYKKDTRAEKLALLEKKLQVMVEDSAFDPYEQGRLRFAWPQDLLYDENRFVGFTMPNAKDTYEFHEIMWEDKQTRFARYDYNRSIAVACNLALTVRYAHEKGYIIGDMNIKNFRFDRQCHVIVLDVDSFDVTDPRTGGHYKCSVGQQDFLAPELQTCRNLASESSRFTRESDYFSLAILIFMFLMNGAHPFNAPKITTASGYSSSSTCCGAMEEIINGNCPYVRSGINRRVPDYAPDYGMLPANIRELFNRTFCYTQSTAVQAIAGRATAEEFARALNLFFQRDKVTCSEDSRHLYLSRMDHCPFCAASRRVNGAANSQPGAPSVFEGNPIEGKKRVRKKNLKKILNRLFL